MEMVILPAIPALLTKKANKIANRIHPDKGLPEVLLCLIEGFCYTMIINIIYKEQHAY